MISTTLTGNFAEDVKIGQKAEKELLAILKRRYKKVEVIEPETNFAAYDVKVRINGQEITYEVKTDFSSLKTGNIAVETHVGKNNRRDGIYKVTANYIVYKLWHNGKEYFVEYNTEMLKRRILVGDYEKKVRGAGIGNAQTCVLFTTTDFIKHGNILQVK